MNSIAKLTAVLTTLMLSSTTIFAQDNDNLQGYTPSNRLNELEKSLPAEAINTLRSQLPRIVGGRPANPGEFPHIVSLMVAPDSSPRPGKDRHFCGGSIVSDRWVLTAAHCVTFMIGSTSQYVVGSDGIDLNNLSEHAIDGIWVHPNYDSNTLDYDFALIRIRDRFGGGAVDLVSSHSNPYIAVGDPADVVGWGYEVEGGDVQQFLRTVQVKVISRADCNDADSYNGEVTSNMICLGVPDGGGKDSCQGDSGGPATTNSVPSGRPTLFGVVSWGYGCARPELYGVYSRIFSVRSWINDHITQ